MALIPVFSTEAFNAGRFDGKRYDLASLCTLADSLAVIHKGDPVMVDADAEGNLSHGIQYLESIIKEKIGASDKPDTVKVVVGATKVLATEVLKGLAKIDTDAPEGATFAPCTEGNRRCLALLLRKAMGMSTEGELAVITGDRGEGLKVQVGKELSKRLSRASKVAYVLELMAQGSVSLEADLLRLGFPRGQAQDLFSRAVIARKLSMSAEDVDAKGEKEGLRKVREAATAGNLETARELWEGIPASRGGKKITGKVWEAIANLTTDQTMAQVAKAVAADDLDGLARILGLPGINK
jgi:hypothetical protein